MRTIERITKRVLRELRPLGAYITNKSVTTSSVYIKFRDTDNGLGSLTIRTHATRNRYRYRWNIRMDFKESKIVSDAGVQRYMYCVKDLNLFFAHIQAYHVQHVLKHGNSSAV